MSDPFKLDPVAWASLRKLLDEALHLASLDRETWIDALAPEHAALKPRLRALLAHAPASSDPFDEASAVAARLLHTLPKFETGQFAPMPPDALPDQRVGPYRLLHALGEGGMASVWLAERTDTLQSRRVALKLPHGAWRRAGLVERMQREREILATLNHPNIATLYDAGVDEAGRPWLALEHVEGERIDAYCERLKLDIPARLALVLQVAQAVAHAHANLVVHRDLKPSNILVTAEGRVKLLDFGIAKLLAQDLPAPETALTQQAGRALTPDYAAPEQILGRPVGTAADVYALGVVLYELLAGVRPYALAAGSRSALEAAVAQVKPPAMSVAATARGPAWQRALRGDLDVIVGKAMKPEPAERYATVAALAEDLQRHLDGEPVAAQPDKLGYRLRKFVGRNKLLVGSGAAMATTLLVATAVSLWQAEQARSERLRADVVKKFIAELLTSANPNLEGGRKLTVDQLLLNARPKIDERFADQPRIRAELLTIVGTSLRAMGDKAAAMPLLAEATHLAEQNLGPDDAISLQARSVWLGARRLSEPGQALVNEMDRLIQKMRATRGIDAEYLSYLLSERAHIAMQDGQPAQAVPLAQEAYALTRAHFGEAHEQALVNATTLALAYQRLGDRAKALEAAQGVYRLAIDVRKLPDTRGAAVDARLMLGMALADAGQLAAGLEQLEAGVRFAQVERLPTDPAIGSFRTHLARYQLRAGQVQKAVENYEAALTILRQGGAHNRRAAATALQLAAAHLAARRPERALAPLEEARSYFAGTQEGETSPLVPLLAASHAMLGNLASAEGMLASFPKGGPQSAFRQGQVARLAGRHEEALVALSEAWARTTDIPADVLARADIVIERGHALMSLSRAADACREYEAAETTLRQAQLQPSFALAEALYGSATCLAALNKAPEARGRAEESAAIWAKLDPQHPMASPVATLLAKLR